jgi:hypothetical protein
MSSFSFLSLSAAVAPFSPVTIASAILLVWSTGGEGAGGGSTQAIDGSKPSVGPGIVPVTCQAFYFLEFFVWLASAAGSTVCIRARATLFHCSGHVERSVYSPRLLLSQPEPSLALARDCRDCRDLG